MQQVIDELARLGVHLRKNEPPGWAVVKRGLRKLNLLAEELRLADPAMRCDQSLGDGEDLRGKSLAERSNSASTERCLAVLIALEAAPTQSADSLGATLFINHAVGIRPSIPFPEESA